MPSPDKPLQRRTMRTRAAAALLAPVIVAGALTFAPAASAAGYDDHLNLPLTNRSFDQGPGGVHPALPTDVPTLASLVAKARASGHPASSYAALLQQYRLAQSTTEAGIDLASWDPNEGFAPNRENMIRSYRYYENFQLGHRELQWAGMGGQVGADFGGGISDMAMVTDIYDLPGLQQMARTVINQVESAFGPDAVAQLPGGLRILAERVGDITTEDLRWFIRQIVVMQKAIFADLMPMHYAYTHEGIGAIEEYHDAGLIPDSILDAWYDIASGDPDRVAAGNEALLRREQYDIVGELWNEARAYRDGLGAAFTYLMTLVGSPSVVGVPALREVNPIRISGTLPDGRPAVLTTPLPSWDWSVFDERWAFVSAELLPRYRDAVDNDWPSLEAKLRVPYAIQFEAGRATSNIPKIIGGIVSATSLTVN